jgi:hypothetical protein
MKTKLKWLLTQGELRKAANCHLYGELNSKGTYRGIDCDRCPAGNYCQDIGYEYVRKLLEHLITLTEYRTECVFREQYKFMLKQLNKEFNK